jgi:hypothetical protein
MLADFGSFLMTPGRQVLMYWQWAVEKQLHFAAAVVGWAAFEGQRSWC